MSDSDSSEEILLAPSNLRNTIDTAAINAQPTRQFNRPPAASQIPKSTVALVNSNDRGVQSIVTKSEPAARQVSEMFAGLNVRQSQPPLGRGEKGMVGIHTKSHSTPGSHLPPMGFSQSQAPGGIAKTTIRPAEVMGGGKGRGSPANRGREHTSSPHSMPLSGGRGAAPINGGYNNYNNYNNNNNNYNSNNNSSTPTTLTNNEGGPSLLAQIVNEFEKKGALSPATESPNTTSLPSQNSYSPMSDFGKKGGQTFQQPHHRTQPQQQYNQRGSYDGGAAGTPQTPGVRPGGMPQSYPQGYISREDAIAGVMSGKYVRGVLNINKKFGSNIAFVRNPDQWNNIDVCIEGKLDRNRAFDKDVVIVEINSRDKWKEKTGSGVRLTGEKPPVEGVAIASREDDLKKPINERSRLPDNERVVCRALQKIQRLKKVEVDPLEDAPAPTLPSDVMITGTIVHIWKSEHKANHSAKAMQGAAGKKFMRFISYDEKFPYFEVLGNSLPENVRKNPDSFLLYLKVTGWPSDKMYPQAELIRILGSATQVEDQSRAILIEHGTDYTDQFDDECLAVIPDTIPIDETLRKDKTRRDMRIGSNHPRFVVSIDPATARDLDDALSCEPLGGGNYRVGVHIADVSAFVPFGSALDEEARKRATSVYLVQKVIPMLPRKLCEEHCSLNTLGDKLAFTVEWTMDSRGRILKEWMGQTVIRNQCKMAYEDAQDIIDDKFNPSCLDLSHMPDSDHGWAIQKIKDAVHGLWTIAANIRQARFDRGALALNQGKMYFDFENNNSNMAPRGWHLHETAEANWLVEEFMVMANARVTEKTIEFCPDNALARWHESPDTSRFKTLVDSLLKKGTKMKVSSGKQLADSLERLRGHKEAATIKALTIRCMKLAKYCCTTEAADHALSHFALNLPLYTHFTSPIRRYADLVVHRVLKCALEIESMVNRALREGVAEDKICISPKDVPSGELLLHEADVAEIAIRCNTRKEEARKCSDQSVELYYCLYLQSLYEKNKVDGRVNHIEKHHATLTKIAAKSFQIFLPTVGCERELFHDNGPKDQLWIGTNKCNSKDGVIYIQWEDGLYQEASILDGWEVNVSFKPGQKLDFTTQLQPPPRSELVTEEEVLAACNANKQERNI